jgi:Helix-turn-helix domain
VSAGNRGQLADFLRSRRARLTPADVGLPGDSEPGRRRTPGLRREEVAELSGIGVTCYTWLEQGRKITASPQVVDALARALRLSADEHRHLRELAGPSAVPGRRDPVACAPVLIVVGGLPATGKSTVASALARQAGFTFVRVDRIEQAIIDSAGLRLPDWEQITSREYEPWDRGHLVIDTATRTPAEAVATILAAIPERAGHVSADPD